MEPFPITCETCHARLKVRSASVIGQILACPKCRSMVHIMPPPGWTAPAADIQPAEASSPPALLTIEASAPFVPPVAAGSPLLLWGVSGAALLLVAGLAAVIWSRGNGAADNPTPAVAVAAAKVADDVPADPDANPVAAETGHVDQPTEAAAPAPTVQTNESREVPAASLPLPELPPHEQQPEAIVRAPVAEKIVGPLPAPDAAEANESEPPAAAPANERPRAPVLKFDPLDFDSSQLSLSTGAASPPRPSHDSVADDPAGEAVSAAGNSGAEKDGGKMLDLPVDKVAVRLGPMSSDALRPRSVADQLALRVESFEVTAIPLARFVEILSDMADVPITLDPVALELAGVSPRAAVTVQAQDATLETLLGEVLSKHRLDLVDVEGRVSVGLSKGDQRRSIVYEVKDLIEPGAGDATQLARWIERLVAPTSWQAAGGAGTIQAAGTKLNIEQTESVHRQTLVFCERLRLARGLAMRSRYPAALLSVESPYVKLADALNRRTTFTFLPWTRLADVVRHWQDATGLTILVDWAALADAELAPTSPLACSAIDQTWDEALGAILEPLGLGWWAVDGQTLQITSRATLDHIQRIEFYSVPKQMREQFASNDALLQTLRNELVQQANPGPASQIIFELDAPSSRLIVLGPPEAQRYFSRRFSHANY